MYRHWDYWGKPIPGLGDSQARLLIIGLAPAAHGGNRTGRMFTGDRSGDWLYRTLYKFGFTNSPNASHVDDGLELRDTYITAAARCVPPGNKPLKEEINNCRPYLIQELNSLTCMQVVVTLGQIALRAYLATLRDIGIALPLPGPRFAHGATYSISNGTGLVVSYHPSQQNTLTGRLTQDMFDAVFSTVRRLLV